MHLLLTVLALAYLWAYLRTLSLPLPVWVLHFILFPAMSTGLYYLPTIVLTVLAICGSVYIIELVVMMPLKLVQPTKRRSNIPPPP